ncbi:unnamed protein product, partial [Ilex paraguariensis]
GESFEKMIEKGTSNPGESMENSMVGTMESLKSIKIGEQRGDAQGANSGGGIVEKGQEGSAHRAAGDVVEGQEDGAHRTSSNAMVGQEGSTYRVAGDAVKATGSTFGEVDDGVQGGGDEALGCVSDVS